MKQYADQFKKLTITARLSLFVVALLLVTIGLTISNSLSKQEVITRAASNSPSTNPNTTGNIVKIDSDKVLNINGKRTFPVGIYSTCNDYLEQNGLASPCNPSNNKEFLFDAEGEYNQAEITKYETQYENAGLYYPLFTTEILETGMPWNLINGPNFFGYYQMDEPSDSDLATVSSTYNTIKAQDPNHPIILNLGSANSATNITTWAPYADVLTWDTYPFLNDYSIGDAMYVYEIQSDYGFFKGNEVNSVSKSVWAVLQANGTPYTLAGMGGTSFLVPSPAQARINTYTALTMDVKGIVYWGYEIWADDINVQLGLSKNSTLHAYYKQLASELRSFNDWLVSPTIDYSWGYRVGSKVTFDKIFPRSIDTKQFTTNWNYILKNYSGSYYLIVVNKEPKAVSNVTMTIAGLTGNTTATTLGIETQGSGRSGRNVPVNNGIFTDSFDGSVVHIYQIGGSLTSSPTPKPTQIILTPTPIYITPTIYCLGSCPTSIPTPTSNPSPTQPTGIAPTIPVSQTPSTSPAPTIIPCSTLTPNQINNAAANKRGIQARRGGGGLSGMLQQLLQFLIQLINQLLQLLGIGGIPTPPIPPVTPTPSIQPTQPITLTPSIGPSGQITPQPSNSPSITLTIPPCEPLPTSVAQPTNSNPSIGLPTAVPISTTTSVLKKEVQAYYSTLVSNDDYKKINYSLVSALVYSGVGLHYDGSHTVTLAKHDNYNAVVDNLITYAHSKGVKVILSFTTDTDADTNFITDSQARTSAVNSLLVEMKAHGYDGIDNDIEIGVAKSDMTAFQSLLTDTVWASNPNYRISLAIFFPYDYVDTVYDFSALINKVNYIFLMGYNYHVVDSATAGPVGPITADDPLYSGFGLSNVLSHYLTEIPANKLILGVPYYGYEWPTVDNSRESATAGTGKFVSVIDMKNKANTYGRIWDSTWQTPWYTYQSGGQWYQGHYDDIQSLGIKYDLANSKGLAGIGMWAMDFAPDNPDLWQLIHDKFTTAP